MDTESTGRENTWIRRRKGLGRNQGKFPRIDAKIFLQEKRHFRGERKEEIWESPGAGAQEAGTQWAMGQCHR